MRVAGLPCSEWDPSRRPPRPEVGHSHHQIPRNHGSVRATADHTSKAAATGRSCACILRPPPLAACWAFFARASFVYCDCATIELFTVPEFDCSLSSFVSVHFDETETARAAGHFVDDYLSRYYITSL